MATTKAYILIESAVGQGGKVLAELKRAKGVLSANRVTGPYDVIAVIETAELKDVGEFITLHVHNIGGIIRTVTCLAIE